MQYWVVGGVVITDKDEAIEANKEYDNQNETD